MTTLKFALKSFPTSNRGIQARRLLASHNIAPEKLLAEIHAQIMDDRPAFVPGVLYSTEQLCGPDIWGRLKTMGPHRAAGACLGHLAEVRAVPTLHPAERVSAGVLAGCRLVTSIAHG